MDSYTPENVGDLRIAEHPRKQRYSFRDASSDLQVIDWLLRAEAITPEDARHMRNYVLSLKA